MCLRRCTPSKLVACHVMGSKCVSEGSKCVSEGSKCVSEGSKCVSEGARPVSAVARALHHCIYVFRGNKRFQVTVSMCSVLKVFGEGLRAHFT